MGETWACWTPILSRLAQHKRSGVRKNGGIPRLSQAPSVSLNGFRTASSIIVVLVASALAWIIDNDSVVASTFIGVEAIARRRFLSLMVSTVLLLATVALGVGLMLLFLNNWRIAISLVLGVAAVALLIAKEGDSSA